MKQPRDSRSRWIAGACWVGIIAWTVFWATAHESPSGLSWHFFPEGARLLVHGSGLDLYAEHPDLQIGPLAFVVALVLAPLPDETARLVAEGLMTAAGPLLVLWLSPLVFGPRKRERVFLGLVVLIPTWTVLSVRWGHLDDVLALVFSVAAIRAVAANRALLAGLAMGAALASKPWALGFVPVLLVLERHRLRAALATALSTAAAWMPFLVANPATLDAFRPQFLVAPSSGLRALGFRGDVVPAWDRTAQLVLAPAAALAAVLRGRWAGLFLVAVAVRLALDPQDNAYYAGGAALVALVFDLLGTRWRIPWATVITVLALWQPFVLDYPQRLETSSGLTLWWFQHPGIVGGVHLAWSVVAVAVVLLAPLSWFGTSAAEAAHPARS